MIKTLLINTYQACSKRHIRKVRATFKSTFIDVGYIVANCHRCKLCIAFESLTSYLRNSVLMPIVFYLIRNREDTFNSLIDR